MFIFGVILHLLGTRSTRQFRSGQLYHLFHVNKVKEKKWNYLTFKVTWNYFHKNCIFLIALSWVVKNHASAANIHMLHVYLHKKMELTEWLNDIFSVLTSVCTAFICCYHLTQDVSPIFLDFTLHFLS